MAASLYPLRPWGALQKDVFYDYVDIFYERREAPRAPARYTAACTSLCSRMGLGALLLLRISFDLRKLAAAAAPLPQALAQRPPRVRPGCGNAMRPDGYGKHQFHEVSYL